MVARCTCVRSRRRLPEIQSAKRKPGLTLGGPGTQAGERWGQLHSVLILRRMNDAKCRISVRPHQQQNVLVFS